MNKTTAMLLPTEQTPAGFSKGTLSLPALLSPAPRLNEAQQNRGDSLHREPFPLGTRPVF
jgi:hypothetical protein